MMMMIRFEFDKCYGSSFEEFTNHFSNIKYVLFAAFINLFLGKTLLLLFCSCKISFRLYMIACINVHRERHVKRYL